ncbi:MAG: FAD-dependent oxidoreductase [Planctomycetota bacterium]
MTPAPTVHEQPYGIGPGTGTRIAIIGAGIAGRLIAWMLSRKTAAAAATAATAGAGQRGSQQVVVFERTGPEGVDTCSATAAGMIAPFTELANRDPLIADIGLHALALWPSIIDALRPRHDVFWQADGSLMVAAPRDRAELDHFADTIRSLNRAESMQTVNRADLQTMEPDLATAFDRGLYFPSEAQVDSREVLRALADDSAARGVAFRWNTEVLTIREDRATPDLTMLTMANGDHSHGHSVATGGCIVRSRSMTGDDRGATTCDDMFDVVIDCRGLAAQPDLSELRGVRGELIEVHAPDVHLRRPIRFLHPRTSAYIVPRPRHQRYLIGASVIESEDQGQISVRSVLELLSAAWTVNPAFAEARVLSTRVNCRPALDDNQPRVVIEAGGRLIRVNGLFRHGYLLGPAVAEHVLCLLQSAGSIGDGPRGIEVDAVRNPMAEAALSTITVDRSEQRETESASR